MLERKQASAGCAAPVVSMTALEDGALESSAVEETVPIGPTFVFDQDHAGLGRGVPSASEVR
eukprot:1535501-Amphidinium_carterae.1